MNSFTVSDRDRVRVTGISPETKDRYARLKSESQQRMVVDELLNDQFMNQLLDVYEYHLDSHEVKND